MSTTESTPDPIELALESTIIEHAEGIPADLGVSLVSSNAIIIRPVGRTHNGEGRYVLHAEVHLGNIEGDVAASLLRDVAAQLDGTSGVEVSDD